MTDPDRRSRAEIAIRLGREALAEVANIVKPDTILGWHRKLVAKKSDSSENQPESRKPRSPGRPTSAKEVWDPILRFARENRTWGFDRIVGALANLGHTVSDQTVGNVLERHCVPPAPERKRTTTWKEFIKSHMDVLAATDFFTAEVWTSAGLMTYYVLFLIHLATRRVHIAGITPNPDDPWMKQIARDLTMVDWGFLNGRRYVIHGRDTKFSEAFRATIKAGGVGSVPLLPHSRNLNAFTERWVRTSKEACVSRFILFGERSLRYILDEFVAHYHGERNHQGRENLLLFPDANDSIGRQGGGVQCRERLGGLLKFYRRATG